MLGPRRLCAAESWHPLSGPGAAVIRFWRLRAGEGVEAGVDGLVHELLDGRPGKAGPADSQGNQAVDTSLNSLAGPQAPEPDHRRPGAG